MGLPHEQPRLVVARILELALLLLGPPAQAVPARHEVGHLLDEIGPRGLF